MGAHLYTPLPWHIMDSMSVEELLAWKPPKVTALIGGTESAILVPKGHMIIYGRWGSYKSMLALDLSMKAPWGKSWLGYKTAGFGVYYLQIEITTSMMQRRVIKYMNGNNVMPPSRLRIATEPWYKREFDKQNLLGLELQQHKPDLLIIDPITRAMAGDLTSNVDAQRVCDILDAISERYSVAICLIGHIRKPSTDEVGRETTEYLGHEWFGSSIPQDWADTMISMRITDETEDSTTIRIKFEKHRHSEMLLPSQELIVSRSTLAMTNRSLGVGINDA